MFAGIDRAFAGALELASHEASVYIENLFFILDSNRDLRPTIASSRLPASGDFP